VHRPIVNDNANLNDVMLYPMGTLFEGEVSEPNYLDTAYGAYKSLQRDSIYRFGCRFVNELGWKSKIYYIGDIRTPSQTSSMLRMFNYNSKQGILNAKTGSTFQDYAFDEDSYKLITYPLGIKFEFNDDLLSIGDGTPEQTIKKIEVLRVPRTQSDRNVLYTGYLTHVYPGTDDVALSHINPLPPYPTLVPYQCISGSHALVSEDGVDNSVSAMLGIHGTAVSWSWDPDGSGDAVPIQYRAIINYGDVRRDEKMLNVAITFPELDYRDSVSGVENVSSIGVSCGLFSFSLQNDTFTDILGVRKNYTTENALTDWAPGNWGASGNIAYGGKMPELGLVRGSWTAAGDTYPWWLSTQATLNRILDDGRSELVIKPVPASQYVVRKLFTPFSHAPKPKGEGVLLPGAPFIDSEWWYGTAVNHYDGTAFTNLGAFTLDSFVEGGSP